MPPRLQEERARQVLAKIDQILAWQREFDNERDTGLSSLGGTCARSEQGNTGGWSG